MLEPVEHSFWTMSGTAEILAPVEQVWEAIASPGSLESCHPFVEKNPVEAWPGAGAKDQVHYHSGLVYYREFCAWEEGVGYDLWIGTAGRLNSKVFWRVRGCGEQESRLTITVRFPTVTGWKKLFYWVSLLVYYRPLMKRYMNSVVSGYRYFITRGEPVPRNQFGPLRPYSPAV